MKIAGENDIDIVIIDIAQPNIDENNVISTETVYDTKTVIASMAAKTWKDGKRLFSSLLELLPELPIYLLETSQQLFYDELLTSFIRAGARGKLDEAYMRRFDRKILIELPNKDEREQFIRMMLKKIKVHHVSDEIIESISSRSIGLSPAVLDNIIETAKRKAFDAKTPLDDKILEETF